MTFRYRIYFSNNGHVQLELPTNSLEQAKKLIREIGHKFDSVEVQRIERFTILRRTLTMKDLSRGQTR